MRNLGAKYSQPFRKRELQIRVANGAWAWLGAQVKTGELASQPMSYSNISNRVQVQPYPPCSASIVSCYSGLPYSSWF